MEFCSLPIELCERILDALLYRPHPRAELYWRADHPVESIAAQSALRACALVCRAWRTRAQRLLWTYPHLSDERSLVLFTATTRTMPKLPTTMLALEDWDPHPKPSSTAFTLRRAGELLTQPPFSNLQYLSFVRIHFVRGPSLQLFRMRLPFFTGITTLLLGHSTFSALREMLDVVWACPNLSMLAIFDPEIKSSRSSSAGNAVLSASCKHLRACRKLRKLIVELTKFNTEGANALRGSFFGSAVTELWVHILHGEKWFSTFIADSFPDTLCSIRVHEYIDPTIFAFGEIQSYLHAIAANRTKPGILKKITLTGRHGWRYGILRECCHAAVGTSEEVVGFSKRLPELLSGLEELTIRLVLDADEGPGRCATYIRSTLPNMHTVLRFEYRTDGDASSDWKSYAIPTRYHPRPRSLAS